MPVRDADLQGLALIEHVELGQRHGVETVDAGGVASDHRVEPAAAPRPAGGRAVFVAARPDRLGDRARHLGGERPGADARRVGLAHADDAVDLRGRHTRARGRAAGGRRGRRDVRIGSVVDVQHRRLRAIEHHAVAGFHPAREQERCVGDIGSQPARIAQIFVQDLLDREGLGVVDLAEQPVLLGDVQLELLAEEPLVQKVGHADPDAGGLVHVRRPHAATGRADAPLAQLGLRGQIERRVVGHDQVRVLGDEEVAVERHPATNERLHLLDQ